jgi:hypothetical protein
LTSNSKDKNSKELFSNPFNYLWGTPSTPFFADYSTDTLTEKHPNITGLTSPIKQ